MAVPVEILNAHTFTQKFQFQIFVSQKYLFMCTDMYKDTHSRIVCNGEKVNLSVHQVEVD